MMNVSYVSFFAMFLMYLLAALFGYLTFYGKYCLSVFFKIIYVLQIHSMILKIEQVSIYCAF